MKLFNIASVLLILILAGCGGAETTETAAKTFCKDSSCMADPIKVTSNAPGKPFVNVTFNDCKIDSIHFEKTGGVKSDIVFAEFIPNEIRPTNDAFKIDMIEGKHAWMRFNDCPTGRGYALKLAFDGKGTTQKLTTALNNFDPKYKVADGLVAYYDNTFIYVQDMVSDKKAQQLLTDVGVRNHDVNDPHSLIDSLNITKENIYAKILFDGKTIEHNKPLAFK